MHAAADGDMKPAKELFRPRKVEKKSVSKSAPPPENWFAELERRQEEAAERFRKSREALESKQKT